MANKSIRETASLDNPAVRTGYQVKAQPVDTFVKTNAGDRERKIAQGLDTVLGGIANVSSAHAQAQAEQARKATA